MVLHSILPIDSSNNWVSPSGLEALASIVSATAAIVVSALAWNGWIAWKRELKGRVEYEVARNLLRSGHRLEFAIDTIRRRQPGYWEALSRPGRDESSPDCEYRDLEFLYDKRMDRVRGAATEWNEAMIEAKAILADAPTAEALELRYCVEHLGSSIWRYVESFSPDPPNEVSVLTEAEIEEVRRVVEGFAVARGNDAYGDKLTHFIVSLDRKLSPYLFRKVHQRTKV